jgi:AraC-like DNA-binding protein
MSSERLLNVDSRPADSPLINTIWHSYSYKPGPFLSIASSHWEMIVANYEGRVYLSVRGPETHPSLAYCPPDGEWVGIQFAHGVFMPHLPVSDLVDGGIDLPGTASRGFWLHGAAWEFPTFENVDTFVARLIKDELLAYDPLVAATLQDQPSDLSPRSVQRRFLRATGLTQGTITQIERAHHTVALLRQGYSILDTVERAGYADQPHLTRSLKRLIGQTPTQLTADNELPLSFSQIIAAAEAQAVIE